MQTVCPSVPGALTVVLRRSLLLAGFLLGCGVVALVTAGSAHAAEQSSPPRSSEARSGSDPGSGLLGGLLKPVTPVASSVAGLTDPVLSGVSQVLAPVVEPVVGVVEPLTAPLLAPVTEPLSPVLEVLAPVTEPLLGSAEPVVTPVARGLGIEPEALGVDPVPAAGIDESDVGTTLPAETSPSTAPSTAGAPAAVEDIGPLWTTVGSSTSEVRTSGAAAESRPYGRPGHGPVSPRQDLAVLAGATGTASSGGSAGGASGQADLPGYHGVDPRDGVDLVPVQRWLPPPWCYVFGRHHPS